MIDPTIRIKEKKNTYSCKIKISKEEMEEYLTTPEGVAELKKDFLNAVANEFDRIVIETVEEENGTEMAEQVEGFLLSVQVCQEEVNTAVVEETEEEVEEEEVDETN